MSHYSTFTPEIYAALPVLLPSDVAEAVSFILSLPSHVLVSIKKFINVFNTAILWLLNYKFYLQVQDIVLRPVGESWWRDFRLMTFIQFV